MLLALIAIACGNSPEDEALMMDQLEAPDQTVQSDGTTSSYEGVAGIATVSGEDQEWQITLATDDGTAQADVHSPTHVDLSGLDGRELHIQAEEDDLWADVFVVSDEYGVVYAAISGSDGYPVDDVLGDGLVDFGTELGEYHDGGDVYTFYSIAVETDDGTVELEPGEVAEITVYGIRWRAGAIAAYDLEEAMAADCGSPDVLSLELLRVDTEETDLPEDRLLRPEGREMAARGC